MKNLTMIVNHEISKNTTPMKQSVLVPAKLSIKRSLIGVIKNKHQSIDLLPKKKRFESIQYASEDLSP